MDYKNKDAKIIQDRIDNLKRIWNNREIIIVEGEKTKLGVNNDLFDNAKKINRIIVPSRNAFNAYDKILEAIKNISKEKLFILSIGPTATVLAKDLVELGYQAVDLGHIDIEYEWFKMGAKQKVLIKGKFVNEAVALGDLSNENITDLNYTNSIIKIIKE